MRYKSKQGIAYSVFPFGSSRQMLLASEPVEFYTCQNRPQKYGKAVPDYYRQTRSLIENVRTICEEEGFTKNTIFMCHFFIADIGMRNLVVQMTYEMFPLILSAVTFVPQSPASGAAVSIELWAIGGKKLHVLSGTPLGADNAAEFDHMYWCFLGGIGGRDWNAYDEARDAFQSFVMVLNCTDFDLEHVLRTWIYQGHLLSPDGVRSPDGEFQRYKELNRARTDYFGETPFHKDHLPPNFEGTVYPASTGIGADDYDVVISGVALKTERKDVKVVPLENPNQTAAFDYAAEYSPQSPKFSRAMAVAADGTCLIFVSGTASIIDSESRHLGDPAKQTEQTLDNIVALISQENLSRHGLEVHADGLEHLESVRVYIKYPSDYEVIRQVCERRLKEIPAIYTIADVCRPELLVEIEGIAVTESFSQ